jgi:hypothetical protein
MDELQALVTGAVVGALMTVDENWLAIDVEPERDGDGNYLPVVHVTGRNSGTRLRISVDVVEP